jgi:hypothetical protein
VVLVFAVAIKHLSDIVLLVGTINRNRRYVLCWLVIELMMIKINVFGYTFIVVNIGAFAPQLGDSWSTFVTLFSGSALFLELHIWYCYLLIQSVLPI